MNPQSEVIAILLLGGVGSRFGGDMPKQYLPIGDKPLMAYALLALEECQDIDKILLVAGSGYEAKAKEIVLAYGCQKVMGIARSGLTREDSVSNALAYLQEKGVRENDIILIHDGDRPCLTSALIRSNVIAAKQYGAAVTAIKAKDSILVSLDGKTIKTYAKREEVYQAQTPQTFRYDIISKAILEKGTAFTDDGSIVLADGGEVHLVEGDVKNIKITTKEDANAFLAMKGENHA